MVLLVKSLPTCVFDSNTLQLSSWLLWKSPVHWVIKFNLTDKVEVHLNYKWMLTTVCPSHVLVEWTGNFFATVYSFSVLSNPQCHLVFIATWEVGNFTKPALYMEAQSRHMTTAILTDPFRFVLWPLTLGPQRSKAKLFPWQHMASSWAPVRKNLTTFIAAPSTLLTTAAQWAPPRSPLPLARQAESPLSL